jgi:hypothetical protein
LVLMQASSSSSDENAFPSVVGSPGAPPVSL